jgi:hypothetical protein
MCTFTVDSNTSPDNLDAMVWAATELNIGASALSYLTAISWACDSCDLPNNLRATVCKGCGAPRVRAA